MGQLQKSQQKLITQKSERALGLAKQIASDIKSLPVLEMNLKIINTLNKPTIRSVFKGELGSVSYAVVLAMCNRFINSFAFSTKLSEEAIESFAIDTLEYFEHESLEDIIIFFKMARSGKFGSTKRGVDSNLIYGEWFPMYLEKKSTVREEAYKKVKSERQKNDQGIEAVKITYTEVLERKNREQQILKAKRFIDNLVLNFDRQMLEDTIKDWEQFPERDYFTSLLKEKRKTIKK